jgi:uncharacterized protein (TIGR03437 family)
MQTGVAAPLSPPIPIQGTLTCQFQPEAEPATTLFAGLAPGMTGIYQVAFRMPADAGPVWTGLSCEVIIPGLGTGGFSIVGVPVASPPGTRQNLP